jgi:membrane protein implicated in regulation of membrane protease activity
MLPLWIFGFLPIIVIILAASLGIFLSDTGLGVATSFALMLLLSTLLFVLYRRAYRASRFDLLNQRSRSEIN